MKNLKYYLNNKEVSFEEAKEIMTDKMFDRISYNLNKYGLVNESYVLKNGDKLKVFNY